MKLVGIVTESYILRRVVAKNLDPSKVVVKEVMSQHLITASPNDTGEDAARVMIKNKIRRVPIVEESNLVGIVTSVNLMKHLGGKSFIRYQVAIVWGHPRR